MERKEFLTTIGVRQATRELLESPKICQIVNYINDNDKVIYEGEEYIRPEAFQTLVENINSTKVLVEILKNGAVMSCINDDADTIAKFYNHYDYKKVKWLGKYTKILVDSEYLKYATKEWTEDVLFKSNYIISIGKNNIKLKENKFKPEDYEYIEPIELNIRTLCQAKARGMLGKVLSRITIKEHQN